MDKYAKEAYRLGLIARTRRARAVSGLSQHEMSAELSIEQGKYKQYETRTGMPAEFHKKFCEVCNCSVDWLTHEIGRPPAPKKKIAI